MTRVHKKALQRRRNQTKIVGWNTRSNVPWLGVSRGFKLIRDHWIAGQQEKKWYWESLENIFPGASKLIGDRIILLHRAFAPDGGYGVEVYHDAVKVGLLAYEKGGWRLYPTGALASLLESSGYSFREIDIKGRIKGKKIKINDCKREYVILKAGQHVGIARKGEGNYFRVKDMAPRGFRVFRNSTLDEVVRVNRAYIERLAMEAKEFISREVGEHHAYVAISGGIDSSVALALTVEALGPEHVTAVYADTGMEFPESERIVEKLTETYGVELVIVKPKSTPIDLIRKYGLMTRNNRWCTRVLKLYPLREFYAKKNVKIVIDGARSLESDSRLMTPRVGVNPLIPGVKRILPLKSWSRLEVQLYARLRGIPVNPLYDMGLQRIGCVLCPAMHQHEIEISSELNSGFYNELYKVLESMGIRDPETYITSGTWRK